MFGGWLPSIFRRGKTEDQEDEGSSDSSSRSASKKSKSKSKSRDSKRSTASQSEDDSLVEKFTVACLNAVMLPARQELSGIFAPVPLLALFCIIWMAATEEVRKHIASVCGIDKQSVRAFSTLLARIRPSLNANSLMIYRVLTTPDQIHTIDPLFTTKLEKRFGRRTIIPADRDKQRDYIQTNTKRLISDPSIPAAAGLVGFAAAAVEEKWQLETRPYPDRPFALNRRDKQMHACFEARGAMRVVREQRIDSCLLPLRDSPLALAILRPTERGGIVALRRELTGKELRVTLKRLGDQAPGVHRVLLPVVDLATAEPSLLPKWRLSGVLSERVRLRKKSGGRSGERVCPQFREIATGASIRIDERGVHAAAEERRARSRSTSTTSSSSSTHSYYSAAIDQSVDPNFNLRLDSPFLFFVVYVETMTPVLTGTYAGSALITPYTRSVSVSSSSVSKSAKSKRSMARRSMDVLSRPLKIARKSSAKSTSPSGNSSRESKKGDKEAKKVGVPKCEECERRSKSSSKSKQKSPRPAAAVPAATPLPVGKKEKSPRPAAPLPVAVAAAATPVIVLVTAVAATPRRVAAPTSNSKSATSVRETLKETGRSTKAGVKRTIGAGRSTTGLAKDGIKQAAKLSGKKIGKGLGKTKQTAVRIAGKSGEKLGRAKSVVSSTAKSIGSAIKSSPVITSLSRSSSRSKERSVEDKETTEESERPARAPDKTTISESSSRKTTTSARPPPASKSSKPSSVTRSRSSEESSCSKRSAASSKPAAAQKPKDAAETAAAAKPAKPVRPAAKTGEDCSGASRGQKVARNVKKGLSKAKGSMQKLFGRVSRSSNPDDNSRD